MEDLDLPSQGVSLDFFHGVPSGLHGQIGDQLPDDLVPADRSAAFLGMKHRQDQRRVSLLFSDRRQDANPTISDLEGCLL